MNCKNLIIILIIIGLLFYLSPLSKKILPEFFEKTKELMDNISKKTKLHNIDTGQKLITIKENTDSFNNLEILNKIITKVTKNSRKNKIFKEYYNIDSSKTKTMEFNSKALNVTKNNIDETELIAIINTLLDIINNTEIQSINSNNILKLYKIDKNDIIKTQTSEELKYNLNFIASYYSNFYNNKINKRKKLIDNIIISTELLTLKNIFDNSFLINNIKIIPIHSKGNNLSGYDNINSNFKFLENINYDKNKYINHNNKKHTIPFKERYGSENFLVSNKIDHSYKHVSDNKNLDSIDSLLPDSFIEPNQLNNNSDYSDISDDLSSDFNKNILYAN